MQSLFLGFYLRIFRLNLTYDVCKKKLNIYFPSRVSEHQREIELHKVSSFQESNKLLL